MPYPYLYDDVMDAINVVYYHQLKCPSMVFQLVSLQVSPLMVSLLMVLVL